MKIFLIVMLLQIAPATPRAAKHGEERTQFTTTAGKTCGTLSHVDAFWYFYLAPNPTEPHGWFSRGFDTRAEAVKWGMRFCPKQGTIVVAK